MLTLDKLRLPFHPVRLWLGFGLRSYGVHKRAIHFQRITSEMCVAIKVIVL